MDIPTDDAMLARFQRHIRNFYPVLSVGHQTGFSLSTGGIQPQQLSTRFFQFTDPDRQWTLTLASDALSLETRHYTEAEEFMDRLLKVVAAVKDTYDQSIRQRVGLRYVNEIRYPGADTPKDWRTLLKPELLGLIADEDLANSVVSATQEVTFEIPDGNLTTRHGFLPQGNAVAPLPGTEQESGPFYLFDLDAYNDQSGDLDENTLGGLFRDYNSVIYNLFRWALEERLFDHLKGSE
jgi:uncharacterized protein (TIGR04255 family)